MTVDGALMSVEFLTKTLNPLYLRLRVLPILRLPRSARTGLVPSERNRTKAGDLLELYFAAPPPPFLAAQLVPGFRGLPSSPS